MLRRSDALRNIHFVYSFIVNSYLIYSYLILHNIMFQIIISFPPVFNSSSLSSSSAGLVRGISLSHAVSIAASLLSHQNSQTSKFFTFVKLVSREAVDGLRGTTERG